MVTIRKYRLEYYEPMAYGVMVRTRSSSNNPFAKMLHSSIFARLASETF